MTFAVYSKKKGAVKKGLPRILTSSRRSVFFAPTCAKKCFCGRPLTEHKEQARAPAEPPSGSEAKERTPPHKDDGAVRQTSNYTKCFVLFAWGQTEQRILKYGKAPNHTKQPTFCKQKPQAPTTTPKKQHTPLLWLGLAASAVNCFLPRAPVSAHLCKNFRFCS